MSNPSDILGKVGQKVGTEIKNIKDNYATKVSLGNVVSTIDFSPYATVVSLGTVKSGLEGDISSAESRLQTSLGNYADGTNVFSNLKAQRAEVDELLVKGDTTIVSTQKVEISDNVIEVNLKGDGDVTADTGGVAVNRGLVAAALNTNASHISSFGNYGKTGDNIDSFDVEFKLSSDLGKPYSWLQAHNNVNINYPGTGKTPAITFENPSDQTGLELTTAGTLELSDADITQVPTGQNCYRGFLDPGTRVTDKGSGEPLEKRYVPKYLRTKTGITDVVWEHNVEDLGNGDQDVWRRLDTSANASSDYYKQTDPSNVMSSFELQITDKDGSSNTTHGTYLTEMEVVPSTQLEYIRTFGSGDPTSPAPANPYAPSNAEDAIKYYLHTSNGGAVDFAADVGGGVNSNVTAYDSNGSSADVYNYYRASVGRDGETVNMLITTAIDGSNGLTVSIVDSASATSHGSGAVEFGAINQSSPASPFNVANWNSNFSFASGTIDEISTEWVGADTRQTPQENPPAVVSGGNTTANHDLTKWLAHGNTLPFNKVGSAQGSLSFNNSPATHYAYETANQMIGGSMYKLRIEILSASVCKMMTYKDFSLVANSSISVAAINVVNGTSTFGAASGWSINPQYSSGSLDAITASYTAARPSGVSAITPDTKANLSAGNAGDQMMWAISASGDSTGGILDAIFVGFGSKSGSGQTASLTNSPAATMGSKVSDIVNWSNAGVNGDADLLWDETKGAWVLRKDAEAAKLYYANKFDSLGELPSATDYHGMFAHVHGTGRGYFSHNGAWQELLDLSANQTISGNLDVSAGSAIKVADSTGIKINNVDLGNYASFEGALTGVLTPAPSGPTGAYKFYTLRGQSDPSGPQIKFMFELNWGNYSMLSGVSTAMSGGIQGGQIGSTWGVLGTILYFNRVSENTVQDYLDAASNELNVFAEIVYGSASDNFPMGNYVIVDSGTVSV